MTDTRELLPCPFCGGPVKLEKADVGRNPKEWFGVVCRNTTNVGGSCCMQQVASRTKEAAIARWQARAQDNRCAELLEAAKIFGALLQPLHDEHKDHHPIYGINSVTITAGDLRRLTKAIAAFEESSAALQKQLR